MATRLELAPDLVIWQGDVREALQQMPDETVQCVVTSPPYFGLRDYGVAGQIGLEPTVDEFVQALVDVFREVRRVLRPDGTLWLNLGDSYNGSGGAGGDYGPGGLKEGQPRYPGRRLDGLKPKDLIGVPWRVAFALQADGWYLRSDIIWHKPNPMPESVTDRPTKSHEYLFLLGKSPQYYYDADAIREPHADVSVQRAAPHRSQAGRAERAGDVHRPGQPPNTLSLERALHQGGRNKRSVWMVATQPFPEAHFATYPPELVEPCILAGTSPYACPHCGAPWKRVVERTGVVHRREATHTPLHKPTKVDSTGWAPATRPTDRFEPGCTCAENDGSGRCIVLDPFWGSGTTGQVALEHGRVAWGCELNPEYVEISLRRLRRAQTTLLGMV